MEDKRVTIHKHIRIFEENPPSFDTWCMDTYYLDYIDSIQYIS